MKNLFVVLTLMCTACNTRQSVQDFMPGVYVRHIQNEYSKGYDTLRVGKAGDDADAYVILRSTTYQRIINGEIKPAEHKTETWFILYDEKNKVLLEQKKGKIISFVPEKNQLLVGSSVYQKISK